MRSVAKLFGRSPFVPIQQHMELVSRSVSKGQALIDAYLVGDQETVETLATEIDALEEEADRLRRELDLQLRSGVFMAVERGRLRQIITVQDSIADKMQNLARLTTLRACDSPPPFLETFKRFVQLNLDIFHAIRQVIDELDELVDAGFGGGEAQNVVEMIRVVSNLEKQADDLQHELLKELFAIEHSLSAGAFFLWTKIFKQVSDLGDRSNRLGNRIRSTLQLKPS
ncbi:MAG: TIGR00153 family protein [Planctomycetota bacterium]